jgi:hypothetical protein
MPSQYSSPLDDLLRIARRQFDEVAGKPPERVDPRASASSIANLSAPYTAPKARLGIVVAGTAAGVPFKLRPR